MLVFTKATRCFKLEPLLNWSCLIVAAILFVALAEAGRASDTIKTINKGKISGRIVGMDPVKIELEQGLGGSLSQEVPVNEILSVDYEAEPTDLKTAKKCVLDGRYNDALTAIQQIKEEPDRGEIQQNIAFYKAFCSAKLALGGSMKIADAGRLDEGVC